MIRRYLIKRIRNQGYLIWFYREHEIDEFLLFTIPFNIKFGFDYFFNIKNILVSYVSLIRTGMNGDAVSAETLSVYGSFYHIRIIPTAAVAKCGEFVYVDRKPDH
jgi:hypothetical protein